MSKLLFNKYLIGGLLVLASIAAIYFYGQRQYESGYSQAQTEYTNAANQAIESARAEDARRLEVQNEVIQNVQNELIKVSADASAANDFSRRLRVQLDSIRANSTASNSTVTYGGQASQGTVSVLTNVFEESDRRAGELAQIADEARARGLACEAIYDSLTSK